MMSLLVKVLTNEPFCTLTDNSADKLVVAKMVRVVVTSGVNHVSDTISGRNGEESVHGIENVPGYNNVPFPQQTSCVLSLFVCIKTYF